VVIKIAFFVFVNSIVFFESIAQSGFGKGYVVLTSGDTVKGFIQSSRPRKNFVECVFRRNRSDPPVIYSPFQLVSFFYQDNYYVSETVLAQGHPTRVFLKVLVQGHLNLFSGKNNLFYVRMDTGRISVLEEKWERLELDSGTFEIRKRKYIGTLNVLTRECIELYPEISAITLNRHELVGIFRKYYYCKPSPHTIYEKERVASVHAEVFAGYELSHVNFNDNVRSLAFTQSFAPVFGAGIEYYTPVTGNRLFVRAHVLISKSLYQYTYQNNTGSSSVYDHIVYNFGYLKFPVGLKYVFETDKWQPYISGGVFYQRTFNSFARETQEIGNSNQLTTTDNEIPSFNRSLGGLWGACGLSVTTFGVRAFFEARMDSGLAVNLTTGTYNALIGVRF